jgi:hypothetical protein
MGRWTTGSENAEWNLRLELGTPKSMILGEGFFKERVSHPSHLSPRSAACLGWKLGVENGDVQNGDLFRIGPYMEYMSSFDSILPSLCSIKEFESALGLT